MRVAQLVPFVALLGWLAVPVDAQAPTLTVAKEHFARATKRLQESDVFKDWQAAKLWVDTLEKEAKAKAEPDK